MLNAAVFCSIIGMFRSDSCFVVSKTSRVLGSSMSEKTLLSEQTVLSVKQVPHPFYFYSGSFFPPTY